MNPKSDSQRVQRIVELEKQLADLQARLPAHSISPGMMLELEELEDELARLQTELENDGEGGDAQASV